MFDRAALKRDVRDVLRGNWGKIFLTIFLWSLLIGVIASISGMLGIFTLGLAFLAALLLLVNPLTVSLWRYLTRFFRHGDAEMGDAFSCFANFGANVGAMFWMELWLLIWSLVSFAFFIIGFMQMGIDDYLINLFYHAMEGNLRAIEELNFALDNAMTARASFFFFLGSIATILPAIRAFAYNMVPFLIGDYPNLGMRECLNISKKIMKGHKWELFVFNLSFFPWYLLLPVTFGIATIYVTPYVYLANAAYYDHVKNLALDNGVLHASELTGGAVEGNAEFL